MWRASCPTSFWLFDQAARGGWVCGSAPLIKASIWHGTAVSRLTESFVRLPTALLEKLLRTPLNGAQWRILLWIIRHTYGWHRASCQFTWYKIAKDLSVDRGGVVRAGSQLLNAGILRIEYESDEHDPHRRAMITDTACADNFHRERCLESALFRRAKDIRKESLKKHIKIISIRSSDLQNHRSIQNDTADQQLTEPAKSTLGKYERLSQN